MNKTTESMPQNVRKQVLNSTNKVNLILLLFGFINGFLFWYYDATVMFCYNIVMMLLLGYACLCLKKGKILFHN